MNPREVDLMIAVMERLRRECPWDAKQDHKSLITYLIEETYELIEAIEIGDAIAMREELGDVLLQVLFHAQIASESQDGFDINDVALTLREKLVSRHPHVFGDVVAKDATEVERNWEEIKAEEKGRTSPTEGVPMGQPALALVSKLVHRGEKFGFESPSLSGELSELSAEEIGNALFVIAKNAAHLGIDPEAALRARARQYARELDERQG